MRNVEFLGVGSNEVNTVEPFSGQRIRLSKCTDGGLRTETLE